MRPVTYWYASTAVGMAAVISYVATDAPQREKEQHIAALIAQLDHEEFATREAARTQLEQHGEAAHPQLRTAVREGSAETRWRAQAVLLQPARTSVATGMKLALIKPGAFAMGSHPADTNRRGDETLHSVRITRPFYLGVMEVTQAEYQKVMDHNPSWFAPKAGGEAAVRGFDTATFPVERVSWFDALAFCNALSERDAYEPHYRLDDVERKDKSIVRAKVTVLGGTGYRLPSEAEWEFACRAGTETPFHYGGESYGRSANAKGASVAGGYGGEIKGQNLGRATRCGSYPPNAWGLWDMHGNVGEWCFDWYDNGYYAASPRVNPTGPETGAQRVWRGGSWLLEERSCRAASRNWYPPEEAKEFLGFRVARDP